jgi:hypothetical protein
LREIIDQGKNLEVHLYDSPPSMFLLITDHSLLYEPYHNGRVILPGDDRPIDERVVRGCIGGQIPLLQVRNTGVYDTTYPILCDHFAYLLEEHSIPLFSGVRIEGCDPGGAQSNCSTVTVSARWIGKLASGGCPEPATLPGELDFARCIFLTPKIDSNRANQRPILWPGPQPDPADQIRAAQPDEILQRFWGSSARRLSGQRVIASSGSILSSPAMAT